MIWASVAHLPLAPVAQTMSNSFTAKFPGRCGICRMRIRKGDEVVWIPPTNIELPDPYDYEKLRGGGTKLVTTKLAHASCQRIMEGREDE